MKLGAQRAEVTSWSWATNPDAPLCVTHHPGLPVGLDKWTVSPSHHCPWGLLHSSSEEALFLPRVFQ